MHEHEREHTQASEQNKIEKKGKVKIIDFITVYVRLVLRILWLFFFSLHFIFSFSFSFFWLLQRALGFDGMV